MKLIGRTSAFWLAGGARFMARLSRHDSRTGNLPITLLNFEQGLSSSYRTFWIPRDETQTSDHYGRPGHGRRGADGPGRRLRLVCRQSWMHPHGDRVRRHQDASDFEQRILKLRCQARPSQTGTTSWWGSVWKTVIYQGGADYIKKKK